MSDSPDTGSPDGYDIQFHFDPVCPFAWLTSRWVNEVAAHRDYSVDWQFISLRIVNEHVDYDAHFPPEYEHGHTAGLRMLRVAAAAREAHGRSVMGDLYTGLGGSVFDVDPPEDRAAHQASLGSRDTVEKVLAGVGLPTSLADALDDESWDVVIRAEFLRGVLSHRRGDRDEARVIFRGVLDRVPSITLANKALYSLSEVYRDEERYIDQLNLLRTVGRLGRNSKRTHPPGLPLSIVVQDSDLGISRGHNRIPVIVTTEPGGDYEEVFLISGGAGKGLFRVDLATELGPVKKGDRKLQVTGKDKIRCDYPDAFKQEFKKVPLSDVDIIIASDGEFSISSSLVIDSKEETFSERLEREAREREEADQRVSQQRPANQIKPGNPVYLRVKDKDRDLGDEFDQVVVKLTAESGDQVQVTLKETSPHSGVFEGTATTGELPAGAQASDTAIEHSPLMAIDRDPKTFWQSEPDGATPKQLTVDMKDLRLVSQVRLTSPDPESQVPVRGVLMGSNDGRFWFRLAGNPKAETGAP